MKLLNHLITVEFQGFKHNGPSENQTSTESTMKSEEPKVTGSARTHWLCRKRGDM